MSKHKGEGKKGSTRFFLNGKPYGPGFVNEVSGPLVLGVYVMHRYQQIELLPEAEPPLPRQQAIGRLRQLRAQKIKKELQMERGNY